jgi:hypothetical protein
MMRPRLVMLLLLAAIVLAGALFVCGLGWLRAFFQRAGFLPSLSRECPRCGYLQDDPRDICPVCGMRLGEARDPEDK